MASIICCCICIYIYIYIISAYNTKGDFCTRPCVPITYGRWLKILIVDCWRHWLMKSIILNSCMSSVLLIAMRKISVHKRNIRKYGTYLSNATSNIKKGVAHPVLDILLKIISIHFWNESPKWKKVTRTLL